MYFFKNSFYLIFGLKLMRPIGRYWPTKREAIDHGMFFLPIRVGILVDETRRSPVKKLLSWSVLTGVWVSGRRPEWYRIKKMMMTLIFSPVPPGWASSGVEAELPHPVHGRDGVIPAVPPPPRQYSSHPGGLEAVQNLHIDLASKYKYSDREVFVVREQQSCVLSCTYSVICHPGMG